jgi:hypothetical protein
VRQTAAALLARGFDVDKATSLANAGLTVARLQAKQASELARLGLSEHEISYVRKGGRPPIPGDVLSKLLFDNRYQCCVCRDPSKPFIVHHIDEWAKSRSHKPANLVVLCLEHHDKAHSKSALSQNLDMKALKTFKESWESEVKVLDARSVIDALTGEYAHWAFINEMRLFELADEHGVRLQSLSTFGRARHDGIVDKNGRPLPVRTTTFYKYEGAAILTRYAFMKELLEEIIEQIPIINISDHLDRGVIMPSILKGDFVINEGSHTFSPLTNVKRGIGQDCRGVRRANNVEISFVFDRWGAASSSSKNEWLVGTKTAASLLQVRDIKREDGIVKLTGTVVAIASFVSALKTRNYADSWLRWRPRKQTRRKVWTI